MGTCGVLKLGCGESTYFLGHQGTDRCCKAILQSLGPNDVSHADGSVLGFGSLLPWCSGQMPSYRTVSVLVGVQVQPGYTPKTFFGALLWNLSQSYFRTITQLPYQENKGGVTIQI
jgi:hypothetical protein